MKSVKITANAIINVSGQGEKFKNDIIKNISDELAAHLVNDCKVAEYLDEQKPVTDIPVDQPVNTIKPRKTPKQQLDDAEKTEQVTEINNAATVDEQ